MTELGDASDGFGPDDAESAAAIAARLREVRPAPSPALRDRVRRLVAGAAPRRESPKHLAALIAGCAVAGALLLLIGAAITFL